MNQRNRTERMIFTSQHCNSQVLLHGNMTGSTLVFGYKFVSLPTVIFSIVGTGTIDSVTYNKDGDGYYISATVAYTGCSSVNFVVAGNAVAV